LVGGKHKIKLKGDLATKENWERHSNLEEARRGGGKIRGEKNRTGKETGYMRDWKKFAVEKKKRENSNRKIGKEARE